jgi:hypothetical protein
MNPWKMVVIQMLLSVTLHEDNITSVIHSPINEDPPALRIVRAVAKQYTLLCPRLKMTNLKLHRHMTNNLTPPHPDVANIRLLPCEQFPWRFGGTPRLHAIVDMHSCHDGIRPELKMQATVH